METDFTPLSSAAGGVLIGLAAVALMALHGRIMGATGILTGALFPTERHTTLTRWALLLGMVLGPWVFLAITGTPVRIQSPGPAAIVGGGLLVGIGVTLGAGCTSGHGVCGLARAAPRSIAATATFMGATALTVFVVRHVLGG